MKRSQQVEILRQGFKTSRLDIAPRVVDEFVETGKLSVPEVLPEDAFAVLRGACTRLLDRRVPLTRKINDPKWHNVEKVTLFRNPQDFAQSVHGMFLHAPELVVSAVWTDNVVRQLSSLLMNRVGSPAELLFGYQSNRVIINRMNGSHADPSILGVHVDPVAEHGANSSVTLDEGIDVATGESTPPNTLNIYACRDLSDALNIEQPPHGFSSESTRLSLVFTRFTGF
jgi:hypothetical protein